MSGRRVPVPAPSRPGSGAVVDPAETADPGGSGSGPVDPPAPAVGNSVEDDGTEPAAPEPDDDGEVAAASEPDAPTTAVPPVAETPPRGNAAAPSGHGLDGPTTLLPDGPRRGGTGGRTAGTRRGTRRPTPPPGPRPPSSGPIPVGRNGALVPGTVIADRYRLVAEVGRDRPADAALWKARDTTLERDVAMTLLVGGWQADARASSALSRATRSAHFSHRHAARVLDVIQPGSSRLPAGVLGAAVAEWTPGRDLAELVAGGPLSPSAALRVVEPLAQAVADAHRAGLVLGLDHPQRVRVTSRANARLAFPMPRGDAEVDDDVRGLGATLYLLLTGRWPSTDGSTPAGLKAAPRGASGAVAPIRDLRPALPVGLAALVDRTLDATGGIRTAAAVHGLIRQLREGAEDDGVLLPLTEDGVQLADDDGAVWHPDDEDSERQDPSTRRKLRIGVTLLVVAVLAIVAFVAFQAVSLLGGGPSSGPPLVIPTSAPPAPAPSAPAVPAVPAAPAAPSGPVQLASIAVYDPSGNPDNPDRVGRAADNDPSTTWSTSDYRQQFPSLKPGIGLMTTFRAPARPAQVVVRSPSPGTTIEIRSAAAPNLPLAQTQLLGTGTVSGDTTTIPLQAGTPTGNLLVWITGLAPSDGNYSSEIAEVTVIGAG
ncbi:protein kinase family protein [Actinomycetospora termitidis]|uniref:Uncharacterized protein n=1 Tax=Actinomycetospora termitidis TaxID=3053470 RepID=A0ABT7M2I0_9PSEU|nr:hypothetical protein [Actinomycetospora sp. Odt1-22]MDL5154866.1 hypothetical protein [Actinomycetospora sp. Odt1-22]